MLPPMSRVMGCAAILAAGAASLLSAAGPLPAQQPAASALEAGGRLRFVADARQAGPVGYRDPLGAISPDGNWLAYTSGDRLRLVRVAGGPVRTLGRPARALRSLAWLPDGRSVAALEVDSAGRAAWWRFAVPGGQAHRLWSGPVPAVTPGGDTVRVDPDRARQLTWSSDGARVAGTLPWSGGFALWMARADGSAGALRPSRTELSFPAWSPDGRAVACLTREGARPQLSLPCGAEPAANYPVAYGPIAFSPDGRTLYYGAPNDHGTLDLRARPTAGGPSRALTLFARDAYAPSVTRDGGVLFGTQDYRVTIAVVPAEGGAARQLTAFQSETPSWSPDGSTIAFTFGSWRRVVDDFDYPNIAQDLGTVRVRRSEAALRPDAVIRASPAEDQSLDWSPDGRWIVLHSHADGLDDVWLKPADGSAPAHPITRGGHETGWPRWSPDGRWIAYETDVREEGRWRGVPMVLGIDPATGKVTRPARRVPLDGFAGIVDELAWAGSADSLAFDASEGPERRALFVVGREGGPPRLVHRYTSGQDYSGLGVAPDFGWLAFVALGPYGYYQVFRVPAAGGASMQVTTDPTDKTQPAVSPDGRSIAFTVVSYRTLFWLMEPPHD
jgi:Tol biopolymer transport system component